MRTRKFYRFVIALNVSFHMRRTAENYHSTSWLHCPLPLSSETTGERKSWPAASNTRFRESESNNPRTHRRRRYPEVRVTTTARVVHCFATARDDLLLPP